MTTCRRVASLAMLAAPLAVPLAACGGDRASGADTARADTARTDAAPPGVAFDPTRVQVGDSVAWLRVASVDVRRASDGVPVGSVAFEGTLVLRGRTMAHPDYPEPSDPCFEADAASASRMPRWAGDARRPWFCFEDVAAARRALGDPRPAREAVVTIDRLTIRYAPTDVVNAARLVRADLVPPHDTVDLRSSALGETRRINVHLPAGYDSSAARYPVLYMPDGGIDEDFPHVVNTVDSLAARGRIRPAIVVGIPNTERRRDLTGPTRVAADSAIARRVGGSAAFRRFIREELTPEVERRWRTTGERAIVGESLAGLFVLETLLEEPALFDHYVALDPSLWWNGGALVDSAASRLASRLARLDGRPRTLYLATADVPEMAAAGARLDSILRAARPRGLAWTYAPRPELTHATIFRATKPAALVEALR